MDVQIHPLVKIEWTKIKIALYKYTRALFKVDITSGILVTSKTRWI